MRLIAAGHREVGRIEAMRLTARDRISERARRLRISEFVAKFDRSGLVAALAETQPDIRSSIGEAA